MHLKKLLIRFFKPLFIVRVHGESAWPVLVPGKKYFASSLFFLRENDFIVFRHARGILVKQVEKKLGNLYQVRGLLSWASGSKDFGLVDRKKILGKLIFI